jgi:hypothetical protein
LHRACKLAHSPTSLDGGKLTFFVKMKWNGNNIVDFLKVYEQHPVLWNIKHKDYCKTKLKDELFKQLYEQLAAK